MLQVLGRAFTTIVVLLNATWHLSSPGTLGFPQLSPQAASAQQDQASAANLKPSASAAQAARRGSKRLPHSEQPQQLEASEDRGVEAAGNLSALGWLQFCRLRLGLYSRLLQELLAAVMDSPAVSALGVSPWA